MNKVPYSIQMKAIMLLAIFLPITLLVNPLLSVFIPVGLLGAYYILRDFRIGFFIIIFIAPFSASHWFPHEMLGIKGLNPLNLLIIFVLGALLLRTNGIMRLKQAIPNYISFLLIPLLFYTTILGLFHIKDIPWHMTEVVAFDKPFSYLLETFVKPCILLVVAIYVGVFVGMKGEWEAVIRLQFFSAVSLAVFSLVAIASSGMGISALSNEYSRSVLTKLVGIHSNELGMMLVIAYAIFLVLGKEVFRPIEAPLFWLGMLIISITIMLTFSRTAFINFVLVHVVFLVVNKQIGKVFIASLIAVIGVFFLPDAVFERLFTGIASNDVSAISAGRIDLIWIPLLESMGLELLFGGGQYSMLWSEAMIYKTVLPVSHPHNAFLRLLIDSGLLGIALMYFICKFSWQDICLVNENQKANVKLAISLAVMVLFFSGITGSSFLPVYGHYYLLVTMGVVWGMKAKITKEGYENNLCH